jgi:hypothetical protein
MSEVRKPYKILVEILNEKWPDGRYEMRMG